MDFALQLIFAGISVGAVYALIAVGLSLTFLVSRVINFGQGSLLMLTAMVMVALLGRGSAMLSAALGALGLAAILMVVVEWVAVRPVAAGQRTDTMGWVVSTLGIGILLQGFAAKFFGSQAVAFPSILFSSNDFVSLFGVRLSLQYLAVLALAVALVLLLELILRRTQWGRAVRAVAHDPELASLMAIPVRRTMLVCFVLSGLLAGVAGLLVAQIAGTVDPGFGFNLMVLGFVAAVVGGMGNTFGALAGGITLGVLEKLVGGYVSTAAEHGIAFAVLMAILAVRPQGLFGRSELLKA
ncbi:MAG: High-affinity branched-chain amino acid transport system permease protein LivH [Rhodocyclaceae bacterium]|nr:High-affinity branched-chain amino acid transport system permease protein LivH [Rhodocyclaceae bacterium]